MIFISGNIGAQRCIEICNSTCEKTGPESNIKYLKSKIFYLYLNFLSEIVTDHWYLVSNREMEAKSDTYYITEVLRGNPEAFAPLVDKYKQLAFSLSMKITRNREDAEEAAQDAFIKAYRSLESFKGSASFKTWLFRIVYTTAISRVRGKKHEFVSFEDHKLSESELAETENAVGQLTAEVRSYQLHKAMDLLAIDDKAILNLYYFEDFPVEEIATIMDLTASNVKIKLFRSRKKLYEQLHGLLKGEDAYVV